MAKRRVTGPAKPVGFLTDEPGAAISFPTPQGEMILELPLERLPELMLLAAQCLDVSAKQYGQVQDPPVLPVWKWEAGVDSDGIAVRFRVPGGGAFAFSLTRELAADMHEGLGEALGYRTERTHRPN